MVNITHTSLEAKFGKSNTVHGTDGNDNITVNRNVHAYDTRLNNTIHLYDGADNVLIGGAMIASGGRNSILGDDGKKNVTVKNGMQAHKGGTNEIVLADKVAHYTTEHYLTIGSVKAEQSGQNIISTGDGDDKIVFTGHFSACYSGQNIINLDDGSKSLKFDRDMTASHSGKNGLTLGIGNHDIAFGGSVHAAHEGKNQITAGAGNSSLKIERNLEAKGVNDILLGDGKNDILIKGNIIAHHKGQNRIVSEGKTSLFVGGLMKTLGGLNAIETGQYDDVLTFHSGLAAHGGSNQISTGAGNDTVTIKGHITAGYNSSNLINLGSGNDTLILDAHVGQKNLLVDAGQGYDVLVLKAQDAHKFSHQYKAWFSDMYNSSVLAGSGFEEVRIDIGRNYRLDQVDWLTKMINQYNGSHSDNIEISLAMDNAGGRINLGDIFTSRDESSISIIDLTGKNANDLHIHNTLASNGYDGSSLRINGDNNDSVTIDRSWAASGGFVHENENYYHVWSNAYGESLYIQDGVDIHVY